MMRRSWIFQVGFEFAAIAAGILLGAGLLLLAT
jgi:hypothetical protein